MVVYCVDASVWVNACNPRECACCASSQHFEPWWPWEMRLLKFFIIKYNDTFWCWVGCMCSWHWKRGEGGILVKHHNTMLFCSPSDQALPQRCQMKTQVKVALGLRCLQWQTNLRTIATDEREVFLVYKHWSCTFVSVQIEERCQVKIEPLFLYRQQNPVKTKPLFLVQRTEPIKMKPLFFHTVEVLEPCQNDVQPWDVKETVTGISVQNS